MLYLKASTIPGAGLGLFTDSEIQKGETICRYEGDVLTYKEFLKRNTTHMQDLYVFYVNKNKCIDAYTYRESLARYANDAAGKTRIKGIRNNSYFDIIKGWPYLLASRKIHPHSEVLVSYGVEYWRELAKLEKQMAVDAAEQA